MERKRTHAKPHRMQIVAWLFQIAGSLASVARLVVEHGADLIQG